MLVELCDECGTRKAIIAIRGGNPVTTSNILSNTHGNQGYALCAVCRNIDPQEWKNIKFHPSNLKSVKNSLIVNQVTEDAQ